MPNPVIDSWEAFNRLAKETLQYEPLSRRELRDMFLQVESLIYGAIEYLLHTTTFVEDSLCYLMAEIASGVIKSRKVYPGKRVKARILIDDERTIEMGAENRRILGTGFDLFKLSKVERLKAAPQIKKIIRTIRVSIDNYEDMLVAFQKESKDYCNLSDQLAHLRLTINQYKEDPLKGEHDSNELLRQMGECIDQMSLIELNVGCVEPNYLYGTIRVVSYVLRRLKSIQQQILRAYSRLILKPVRERSRGEMEAFDLYQSGSFGLAHAISTYDVRCGTSFPVYANQWIRQRILGSTKHSSPLIRLPGSVWEMYQKIRAAERRLEAIPEKRNSYSVQDVAELLETSVASVEQVIRKIQSTKVVSLESLAYGNEDGHEDGNQVDRALTDDTVDENSAYEERVAFVEKILNHVDKARRNLVCLRFGVIDRVDNVGLDSKQVLKEIFRQTACKAVVQGTTAKLADQPSGWTAGFSPLDG
jgi:RNA polymerase sigma factor (sigma-70 family)